MKKLRERGVSIKKLNLIMFILALITSGVLFFAMYRTTRLTEKSQDATRELYSARQHSFDLQRASDYLTEQIRSFVVTGEKEYLDNYFYEADVTQRREHAMQNLERTQGSSAAVQKLRSALDDSMELMEKEYYAARLTVEYSEEDISRYPEAIQNTVLTPEDEALSADEKQKKAVEMVYGDAYMEKKESIADHMEECLNELNKELNRKEANAENDLEVQELIEHALTVVLIVILLMMVLFSYFLMIRPLRKCIETIRSEQEIDPTGAYEVRFLAKTYNLIFRTNAEKKEKLTYEATHDEETGLYNRKGYDYLLRNVDMETAALLLVDMDNYKDLRATGGPEQMSRILSNTAEKLLNMFRSTDYVCRVGDDAFAIIMMHADDNLTNLIREKFEKIRNELGQEKDGIPAVKVSAGVAFGRNGDNTSSIFRAADEALYFARKDGKSGIHFQKAN